MLELQKLKRKLRNTSIYKLREETGEMWTIHLFNRKATIRPKRRFVPSDNSSQTTIRPKRQFVLF